MCCVTAARQGSIHTGLTNSVKNFAMKTKGLLIIHIKDTWASFQISKKLFPKCILKKGQPTEAASDRKEVWQQNLQDLSALGW